MTDTEKDILNVFAKVIPAMSEKEKYRLLGYGEGIAVSKKVDISESSEKEEDTENE